VTQEADPYADFDSYYDGNVRIKLTRIREYETDIYLAEIVISDAGYLKSAFAENTFGRNIKAKPSVMAEEHNAILAVNGDFYGAHKNGYVFRNGTLYQSSIRRDTQYDDLLIYKDGSFGYINEKTTEASTLAGSNVWHLLRFGPVLLDKGQITVDKVAELRNVRTSNPQTSSGIPARLDEEEVNADEDPELRRANISNPQIELGSVLLDEEEINADEDPKHRKPRISNPRTALGIFEPLHYLFVVADGRTKASAGLSLYELAEVMKKAGVTMAYNLDGGGSSVIYYKGSVVNNPTDGKSTGERKVSDIVYVE
jgi:exopolysaccharide biosynthesis protein